MRLLLLIVSTLSLTGLPASSAFSQAMPPLLTAIKNNDATKINALLKNRDAVSVTDDDGDNALMYAALYSSADCMRQLLQKGADPNAKNKLGETAIMWCADDVEKTKLLLQFHADLNTKTTDGNTAFLVACVGNAQFEMLKLMLDHGADPLLTNNHHATSLMRAAIYGDTATASLLLSKSVDVNAKSSESETALIFATRSGNKNMFYWLLAHGADVNAKDNYKATPLYYAVLMNDIDMVKALLEKTTNINDQDIDGTTALMWAVYSEYDNPLIVQALIDKGAVTSLKDKKGETVLTWALKKGNTPTVALLKKMGAEL